MAPRRLDAPGTFGSVRGREPPPLAVGEPGGEELLEELCSLIGRLDAAGGEQAAGDLTRALALSGELGAVLKRATELLQELERQHLEEDEDDELDFDSEPPTVDGLPIVVPTLPRLADICFAAGLELNRAAGQLGRATSLDDALVAQETAGRKLRRAVRAVLEAAEERGLGRLRAGEHLRHHFSVDLAATLALRRLYADFRRALRPAHDSSPEAVLTALRYAAGALASLISSADYARARVSDRAILRRLQHRLFAWAHGGKPPDRGLELLGDVGTVADLLRGINRRQELKVHDAELLERLGAEPGPEAEAFLRDLPALYGLDDQLDALIERSRRAPDRALVDQARLRLAALR